jgi:hypothetical protein
MVLINYYLNQESQVASEMFNYKKMKKVVFVILIALFAVSNLQAQSADALTNTTIIKMVKGKLSDDLIIDEINSSKVNFDLSDEGIKTLTASNVSDQVMQAMKAVSKTQNPAPAAEIIAPAVVAAPAVIALSQAETPATPAVLPEKTETKEQVPAELQSVEAEVAVAASVVLPKDSIVEPVVAEPLATAAEIPVAIAVPANLPAAEATPKTPKSETSAKKLTVEAQATENNISILIEQPILTVETVSYVQPVADLIPFYNTLFSSFSGVIQDWDKKLKASLEKEKQSNAAIAKIEKELTLKKNADAKPFSKEITDQKQNLVLSWENHKKLKTELVNEGKSLVEELKKISKETESAIDAKFKDVSKNIKSTDPDPSKGETAKAIQIPKQKFKGTLTGYFAPSAMMLVCYQNEIIAIHKTIDAWNEKALARIKKDAELKTQLDPLQAELSKYLAGTKQDQKLKKKEITALKKQCDALEKERKTLAKQMTDDSAKLSEEINKMKTEAQSVVLERFADIIEKIEHSYQDKFNL